MKWLSFLLLASVALGTTGCLHMISKLSTGNGDDYVLDPADGKSMNASGPITTSDRKVADFHGLTAGGIFHIEYQPGPSSVKISAQANVLDHVKTEVKDGTLNLNLDGKWNHLSEIRVVMSSPKLDSIELSGVTTMKVADLKASQLHVSLSGVAKLEGAATAPNMSVEVSGTGGANLQGVNAEKLVVSLEGACSSNLSGSAKQLTLTATGASHAEMKGLSTEDCDVTAEGASRAEVNVNKTLHATASGASNVSYQGNTAVAVSTTVEGAAHVSRG